MVTNNHDLDPAVPLPLTRDAEPSAHWTELASEALESLSRIVRAEIHLAEAAVYATVSAEVDRVLKALIALVLISLGAVCGLIAALFLLHLAFATWWPPFAIVAALMLTAGVIVFITGHRRVLKN